MRDGLDRIDLKLLASLQQQARISNLELARQVSMSASASLSRVQRLRELGFICGEVTVISPVRLGPVPHATLEVELDAYSLRDHRRFQRIISGIQEVIFAAKTSGRYNYLLAVTTPDMRHLARLCDDLLDGELGIRRLVTDPILDVVKSFSGFPIHLLAGQDAPVLAAAE